MKSSEEIREAFLKFFESKGHLRVNSSSLIPVGDPTLLLTNAGMVQFKPYYSGEADPPSKTLTTAQKSFRTVDIDEVGDATHHTLFEMLGNFSIGDYFKKGAIELALECLESVMGLPKERFAATVHLEDDETFELWRIAGIPEERIYKFGDNDNWWGPPIHGSEGPCGPCAELHYDAGVKRGCKQSDCGPNCQNTTSDTSEACDRYVELWNLVFMQYYHHPDGHRTELGEKGIDTGMGLERLVSVLQLVEDSYSTDLFIPIINKLEQLSGKTYGQESELDYAMRVIAEHSRSASFLIADGVVPANEGRGYVLRRVIRRAIRHARRVSLGDAFLGDIALVVIDKMESVYPELGQQKDFIMTVLALEEEKFQQAYQNGYNILSNLLDDSTIIPADTVFQLWDTYGFPVEMTQEIASEKGVDIDLEGFRSLMETQRDQARLSARFVEDRGTAKFYESLGVRSTKFLGYEQTSTSSVVVGLISDKTSIQQAEKGDEVEVILAQTPFYPEGGGQVGDAGKFVAPGGLIEISDTQNVTPQLIVHFGKITEGKIALGETVDVYIDTIRRENIARNHTATHLLHAALRQVLGPHVRQAGSLVASDRLRFDFSHVEPLTKEEIWNIQLLVNEKIRQNASVHRSHDSYSEAIKRGALAFFGDKYDETVRLVEIANGSTFSFEVCGGTHVGQTGELGSVYILNESSIGSGMRRIEAVSGRAAENMVRERLDITNDVSEMIRTPLSNIKEKLQSILNEVTDLRRTNEVLQKKFSLGGASDLLQQTEDVNGKTVLACKTTASSVDSLREMGDWLKNKLAGSSVVVLGSVIDEQPILIAMVTPDLVTEGIKASTIVKKAAKVMGGGGGGRPDVAQAGGRNPDLLDDALKLIPSLIREYDK